MTPERIAELKSLHAKRRDSAEDALEWAIAFKDAAGELLAAAEQLAQCHTELDKIAGVVYPNMKDGSTYCATFIGEEIQRMRSRLTAAQERIRFLEMEYAKLLEHNSDLEEACEAVKSLTQCDVKMSGKRYYFRTSRSPDVHDAILLTLQALEKKN